ncbi:MAG: S8 family serine peptidase [Bacteroidales bacterium]|nr:S8 family serine peptidase [Bacteroidales bacterium]
MKKLALTTFLFCAVFGIASAQNSYWVFFTDKQNTTFDPYQYFDAKAIERYALNGADLYDITNYPVNSHYAAQVETACEELVGTSRWLNAAGVMATEEQIAIIRQFPFVAGIQLIACDMEVAEEQITEDRVPLSTEQVSIHHGELFQQHNISGKGVRVAVFDAGFPDVDTHPAFKHLRDNNQIVKTWNFVKKKENVYEANSHGRMVLSCIAGKNGNQLLGMAPDAQFLLARTEVASEPKKEEVWWVQALEWADQNGADIVNSSLGYGKQRYMLKHMDGKTSMVAKAANTAARKGILVCNSMGNEGTDNDWKMLITPADADSILSVGAVKSLDVIASFSSFGPTADGRMKPNVVAMGVNNLVAGSKGNFTRADGTSFSSPMMAGFAACVKQLHPEYTAWQLKTEIEKSGNHYPYFDYAFGYGVPQAGYFFGEKPEVKDNLTLYENEKSIYVTSKDPESKIFFKIVNGDGTIERYSESTLYNGRNVDDAGQSLEFPKYWLKEGQTLEIWSDGQHLKHRYGQQTLPKVDSLVAAESRSANCNRRFDTPDNDIYKRGILDKYKFSFVLNASFMIPAQWQAPGAGPLRDKNGASRSLTVAFDNSWKLARVYGLGFRIGFGSSWYAVDRLLIPGEMLPATMEDIHTTKNNLKVTKFDLELFQRFFLGSTVLENWYLDTGIFGEWNTGGRYKYSGNRDKEVFTYEKSEYMLDKMNLFDYGVRLRVGITRRFAIYGQYRISNLLKKDIYQSDLPKWEIGIQIF